MENAYLTIVITIVITSGIWGSILGLMKKKLVKKDKEIMGQRDEISALFQQANAMNEELYSYLDEIKDNYLSTVKALANSIEANDKYTKGHCERVTKYALRIAQEMNYGIDDMSTLEFAGILHDIGKIGIPTNVLNKNGKLTEEEFEVVKNHPKIGYDILKEIDFLKKSIGIMLQHHEKVDGSGYPFGINGDQMNGLSKILAVADSFDAMTSSRPYRKVPLTTEEAVNQLVMFKNTQFDPEVVDVFVDILRQENLLERLEV